MLDCWQHESDRRPTFATLATRLENILQVRALLLPLANSLYTVLSLVGENFSSESSSAPIGPFLVYVLSSHWLENILQVRGPPLLLARFHVCILSSHWLKNILQVKGPLLLLVDSFYTVLSLVPPHFRVCFAYIYFVKWPMRRSSTLNVLDFFLLVMCSLVLQWSTYLEAATRMSTTIRPVILLVDSFVF